MQDLEVETEDETCRGRELCAVGVCLDCETFVLHRTRHIIM